MPGEHKDGWAKIEVLVAVMSALVAVFGAYTSWQSHVLSERQDGFNQHIEELRQATEAKRLELDEDGSAQVAAQTRVSQSELLAGLLEPLVSEDPKKQKLAIEILVRAVPDGQRIVELLKETGSSPETKQFASDQLAARRAELVAGLFDVTVEVRGRSASELWNWAASDPRTTQDLLAYALQNLSNGNGTYNSLTVLLRTSPAVLNENCPNLRAFLAHADKTGPKAATLVASIRARADGCSP